MFNNIGGKIKGLAKVCFFIEAITSIIAGISISNVVNMAPISLLLIIVGPLIALVSSWLLYGFGELIESNKKAETYLSEIHYNLQIIREEIENESEDEDNNA